MQNKILVKEEINLHSIVKEARRVYKGYDTIVACIYYEKILDKVIKYAKDIDKVLQASEKLELINLITSIGVN